MKDQVNKLNQLLKQVQSEYSMEGVASEMPPMPGLEIKNFGLIQLPLIDPQASELIKICKQAPFGLNEKSLIDTKVRDSFQLNPSHVKITNPNWPIKLGELVKRVAKKLACPLDIEARLYKLLVYKEGGHFAKHRDTEKEAGMFGTLVIQLPSRHTGGELIVYENNGEGKVVCDFGQKDGKNEFEVYFAAHFADCEHELRPITSGYRLALVYSLCWPNGNDDSLKMCAVSLKDETRKCLKSLIKSDKNVSIAIMLDHAYTNSSLSSNGVRALKGIDYARYELLRMANEGLTGSNKLDFYICNSEIIVKLFDKNGTDELDECPKSEYYAKRTSEWSEDKRETFVRNWYNIEGDSVFENLKIGIGFFNQILVPSYHFTSNAAEINNELSDEESGFRRLGNDDDENWGNSDTDDDDDDSEESEDSEGEKGDEKNENEEEDEGEDEEDEEVKPKAKRVKKEASVDDSKWDDLKNWVKRRDRDVLTMGNQPGIAKLTTYGKYMLVFWPMKSIKQTVDRLKQYR